MARARKHTYSISQTMKQKQKIFLRSNQPSPKSYWIYCRNGKENKPSEKHVKLSGGAVFNKDKLKGFLNEEETNGYRWVTGEIEDGAITIPSILEEGKFVTVIVDKASARIIPKVYGDQISFTIEVEEKGSLSEQQETVEFRDNSHIKDYLQKLEDENKKIIEEEVNQAIEVAQQDFQTDILGFGRALNKDYPKKWNEVKDNWEEIFPNVPYTVNVKVNLLNTGLVEGTPKPN